MSNDPDTGALIATEATIDLASLLTTDIELRARKSVLLEDPAVVELKQLNRELRELNAQLAEQLPEDGITFKGNKYSVNTMERSPLKRKALEEHGVDLSEYDVTYAEMKKRVKRG
jgi:hypothetical protein